MKKSICLTEKVEVNLACHTSITSLFDFAFNPIAWYLSAAATLITVEITRKNQRTE